jgi:hypothetical protein
MNERIKELAEQAGWGKGETQDDCMACSTFDREEFAELIVRECVELFPERHYYYSGPAVKRNIKKHFGVKE